MTKLFTFTAIVLAMLFSSCCKYDDSKVWNKLNNHEQRISKLEELCRQLNTNIEALQTIVEALEKNDYITNVSPINEDGEIVGYTISFANSDTITIYNGVDGEDGYTPQIGVKEDTDGIYYWTIDDVWLLDSNGNKIKAVGQDGQDGEDGTDGRDGQDGADGITPSLKIENDYWCVSYDNGATWIKLGRATGEDGMNGDSFFAHVRYDEYNVYFTLINGEVITIPLLNNSIIAELNDITFVPRYNDNKATVTRYTDGVIYAEFDFMVSPTSVATVIADNYDTLLSMKAVETLTRSATLINMPIVSCTADIDSGIISVITSGVYLNPRAFDGEITYSASLIISDDKKSIASDYIELCTYVSNEGSSEVVEPEEPDTPDVPALPNDDKVIYYTTSDSAPVELGATVGFGGVLLSNEYDVEANIGKLTFSTAVTCIPQSAFSNSTISSIIFPETVTEIDYNAFYNSHLTEVTIPESVTGIGESAFSECIRLKTASVQCSCRIGKYCFRGCKNLTNVIFGNNVTRIGYGAFLSCYKLPSVNIPDNVTSIEDYAFYQCENLRSVIIGNGVTSIGEKAFQGCDNLTEITLGCSINTIGELCFNGCNNLEYVYINDIASYCTIDYGANNLGYVNSYTSPFTSDSGCKLYLNGNLLEELVIPDGVTKIGIGAFYNCDQLTSISIPNSVQQISSYAFYDCDGITSVEVPGVSDHDLETIIGKYAFSECSNLSNFTIGERVSYIGDNAFYNCSQLQSFYSKPTIHPQLGSKVFYGTNDYKIGTEIYVPRSALEVYKGATNWRDYVDNIYGYDF